MNIELIATWLSNYENSKRSNLLSFPTLINLASLTPNENVAVLYEQIKPINYNSNADLVGLSFISPFADYTFSVADKLREIGKKVVLGGPYVTLFPERCLKHADSIVIDEAEVSWPRLINDFKKNKLEKIYYNEPLKNLSNLPSPRYDLITDEFILSQSITATRGCPFSCNFCFLKATTPGFRVRPINDVIRDLKSHKGKNWLQNKLVWFWDDNLIGDIKYAKELFKALKPLKKWWIAQVTSNFAADEELIKLAADSGCIAVYIGFESFNQESLKDVRKFHNRVHKYREIVKKIHNYGICVSSGLMVGFDHDTNEVFDNSVKVMNSVGIDWVNANIVVPFEGTPLYNQLKEEKRILTNNTYFHNGSVTAFKPKLMKEEELNDGFHNMVKNIFSYKSIVKRAVIFFKDVPIKKIGAYLIFLAGNILFHFLKRKKRILTLVDRIYYHKKNNIDFELIKNNNKKELIEM